jgi:hypothetical protein
MLSLLFWTSILSAGVQQTEIPIHFFAIPEREETYEEV